MRHKNKTFRKKTVLLDGNEYISCRFLDCTIEYRGGGNIVLDSNSFQGCRWSFAGEAANTLAFMGSLYAQGGESKALIEQTFNNIRGFGGPSTRH